ncbi:hypothetical protein, partial [Coprococcus sp. AM11-30B]|uniref:hypothetical protein n=1 Tax=Coprococcus sp. AM11-30B TaxID=2997950 RepID=UPI0022DEAE86
TLDKPEFHRLDYTPLAGRTTWNFPYLFFLAAVLFKWINFLQLIDPYPKVNHSSVPLLEVFSFLYR